MHEREQHLRVLADKLLFVVEKNADGFTLSRTADVSRPVQHQGFELEASRGIALDVEAARPARRLTFRRLTARPTIDGG